MTALARAKLQGVRLRAATLIAGLAVLTTHLTISLARTGEVDGPVVAVDVGLAVLLLAAAYAHIHSLVREREREIITAMLLDLAVEPQRIHETAGRALELIANIGLAQAGVLALAREGHLSPIAALGYPIGWLDRADLLPLTANVASPQRLAHPEAHPWGASLPAVLGRQPAGALIPVIAGDQPIGVLLLAAHRPGVLADLDTLATVGSVTGATLHQAELYEAAYERERALEDQSVRDREFLAAIANEVRTPLASIAALAELIATGGTAPNDDSTWLISLAHGVERLDQLINDLMGLGGIPDTGLRATPVLIDVNEAIRVAAAVLRPALKLATQSLTLDLPDAPVIAFADRRHVEQIVLNLLSNANRRTPPRGEIRVTTTAASQHAVRIMLADSGPDIAPGDRDRIFEPYYRVASPTIPDVPGAGLGLAVARRLVRLQGGSIWVERVPTGGARFCVELPGAAEDARPFDRS
jgi:signal transduction histidine kinase